MASAYPEFDDISEKSEPCVEPKIKQNTDNRSKSDDIRAKAFIPKVLPKDFLRVMLDQKQVNESSDEELARRLQFGAAKHVRRQNQHEFIGRLQIEILEAQLNKNYGLVKMDPYVRMTIASKVYETPTDYSGAKHPKWFKTIMCYIPSTVDMINFEVFDEKSFTDDELIACVRFPLPESLFKSELCEEWLPLSGKLGEQKEGSLHIRIVFTSMAKIQQSESGHYTRSSVADIHLGNPPNIPQRSPEQIQNHLDEEFARAIQISASESLESPIAYTDEDLKNLHDMFSSFDIEVIKSLLDANKGNKEATIESILQMSA